jgi:hypothetical protein
MNASSLIHHYSVSCDCKSDFHRYRSVRNSEIRVRAVFPAACARVMSRVCRPCRADQTQNVLHLRKIELPTAHDLAMETQRLDDVVELIRRKICFICVKSSYPTPLAISFEFDIHQCWRCLSILRGHVLVGLLPQQVR